MLQIKNITKKYVTGNLEQMALDGISLDLRDNEFVAVLGPSGSGKTTLLNIIGGLDRYDSGDLIINGVTTKEYKDRDWDSYRNHTIGFVFQSYNLIPHQTVLSNVELALTIGGISRGERRKRAQEALEKVGLGDQGHKKPNQMSGGQMQRVAIARALVNDPDILLADEPTGALDSDTSVQVMDLLKEVAKDRLVVMVTHNPELAEKYATRIVTLKDGKITSDSMPFDGADALVAAGVTAGPIHKNLGKASMSFLTALSLSFNNLKTKLARTLLVAFAGSIGIIGIALILSLSNGVNNYIEDTEQETLSEYPLQIQKTSMDLTSLMSFTVEGEEPPEGDVVERKMVSDMFSSVNTNDLISLRNFIEGRDSGIYDHAKSVEYTYNVVPYIYRQEGDKTYQVNPDKTVATYGASQDLYSMMGVSTSYFSQLPENDELYKGQYEIKAGKWPSGAGEAVLVLMGEHNISDYLLYILGFKDYEELEEMLKAFSDGKNIETRDDVLESFDYEDFIGVNFKVLPAYERYSYDERYDVWTDKSDDEDYMTGLISEARDLTISGIAVPAEDARVTMLSAGINYTPELTYELMEGANSSDIVKDQLSNRGKNVLTGNDFSDDSGSAFSMDSLFEIDEDAFKNAFSVNASGLDMDLSGLDLSDLANLNFDNLDLSGLSLDNLDLSELIDFDDLTEGLDLENMDLSELLDVEDLSELLDLDLEELLPEGLNLTQEEIEKVINGIVENLGEIDVNLSEEDVQKLYSALMAGYISKYGTDFLTGNTDGLGESISEYLASEEVQKLITDALSNAVDMDAVTKVINDEMASQITSFIENMATPNEEAITEAVESLANQVGEKILKQYSSAIEDAMKQYSSAIEGGMTDYSKTLEKALTDYAGNMEKALTTMMTGVVTELSEQLTSQMEGIFENAFNFDDGALENAFKFNLTEKELEEIMMSMLSTEGSSYESNLRNMGYADVTEPYVISIYPIDFDSKEDLVRILDEYNQNRESSGEPEKVIHYTDIVGTLMSSVTDIINSISYVLIAFVAISLVVSSIMIGVITYISVLERRKEIGILRAIGASKRNISGVFNAETFIIGLLAGLFGVGIARLLLIPGNIILHSFAESDGINAVLPIGAAVILVTLSVVLTLIGGIIPSRAAAKSDPVTALRTD